MGKPNNDFWLVAPFGWVGYGNMIRVQKTEATTALRAIEEASRERLTSQEGYTLFEEMANHGSNGRVFVYECKEVGEYEQVPRWKQVGK